ncbi:hypothetical protein [Aeoliella mucimassa]|nr:hypothetical protein [Aeoliella mucimassa]
MRDPPDASNSVDPFLRPLLDTWALYTQQWTGSASQAPGPSSPSDDPAEAWIESTGQMVDQYLRSPSFLQLFRLHIETLIALKSSAKPPAAPANESCDIDTVIARISEVEKRLTGLEQRIKRLEGPP